MKIPFDTWLKKQEEIPIDDPQLGLNECCSDHIYESYCPCCNGSCENCSEKEVK